jgi:hypothetical protein
MAVHNSLVSAAWRQPLQVDVARRGSLRGRRSSGGSGNSGGQSP